MSEEWDVYVGGVGLDIEEISKYNNWLYFRKNIVMIILIFMY